MFYITSCIIIPEDQNITQYVLNIFMPQYANLLTCHLISRRSIHYPVCSLPLHVQNISTCHQLQKIDTLLWHRPSNNPKYYSTNECLVCDIKYKKHRNSHKGDWVIFVKVQQHCTIKTMHLYLQVSHISPEIYQLKCTTAASFYSKG